MYMCCLNYFWANVLVMILFDSFMGGGGLLKVLKLNFAYFVLDLFTNCFSNTITLYLLCFNKCITNPLKQITFY